LAWQPIVLAILLARPIAGNRTAISKAMIAMTTSSSTRVNPKPGAPQSRLAPMDWTSRGIADLAFDCLTDRPLIFDHTPAERKWQRQTSSKGR